eukprot:TRINITY_DN2784_c0_g1_i6.p1 TRINITY_DN2784_c0_g1~~TRINITY_DN2784_c0_g1_i6.p1  ORF type:complete len:1834 (-),score=489.32 TRINITY_DN2784_c0_g1_i6:186-5687(-)
MSDAPDDQNYAPPVKSRTPTPSADNQSPVDAQSTPSQDIQQQSSEEVQQQSSEEFQQQSSEEAQQQSSEEQVQQPQANDEAAGESSAEINTENVNGAEVHLNQLAEANDGQTNEQPADENAVVATTDTSDPQPKQTDAQEQHQEQEMPDDGLASIHTGTHIPGPPRRLTPGFFYNTDDIILPDVSNFLPGSYIRFSNSIGFESHRRYNVQYIDRRTIVYTTGNTLQFMNLETMQPRYLFGLHCRGIGSFCVHPSKKYIAVGEKGNFPGIFIYEYPSLKLYRILRRGTEKSYSTITFNTGGDKLASVGSFPDYMLTVWDWMQESIILRYKAFSQEVFKVSFFPHNDGRLTTSGTGHIRFWKMARTFTGLKLQGDIGKFGNVELSDVSCFAEWPDGKVISGSEKGTLLMWDGNLIKMEIWRKDGRPCHDGMIEAVCLEDGSLYTAGHDGFIRIWSFESIDNAELNEGYIFELEPKAEFKIGDGVIIRNLIRGRKHWLIQGAEGNLWQYDDELRQPMPLISYHSGAINSVVCSPVHHHLASIGGDGSVRLYDYMQGKVLCKTKFNAAGCCLVYTPKNVDSTGLSVVAGFGDGVVRVLCFVDESFTMTDVFKPHTSAVNHISFSPSGRLFATASDDHTIFLFEVDATYSPIGFISIQSTVKYMGWHPDSSKLLVLFQNDKLVEIDVPDKGQIDTSVSFEITPVMRDVGIQQTMLKDYVRGVVAEQRASKRVLPKPKDGEELTEEQLAFIAAENEKEELFLKEMFSGDTSIACVTYSKDGSKILVNSTGPCAGYLFAVSADNVKSFEAYPSHHPEISFMGFSSQGKLLLSGGTDGSVIVRQYGDMNSCWRGLLHDCEHGKITSLVTSFDDSHLFSAGRDGNLFVYRVSISEMLAPSEELAATIEAKKQEAIKAKEDIVDKGAYSIQEAKLKSEHDRRVAEAETKKQAVRRQLAEIRQEFQRLLKSNERAPAQLTLDRTDFNIEDQLREDIEKQTMEKIDQAQKKLAWICEKKKLGLRKLRSKFLDTLAVERIVLKGFKNHRQVSTFRVAKLSAQLKENIENVHGIINSEEALRLEEGYGDGGQQSSANGQTAASAGEMAEASAVDTTNMSKADVRKAQRAARAKVWDELMAKKPDEKYEDPDDVAAIAYAEKHMGDYKLKTDDDYIVPEHQRVNAEKKRRQMILLEESVFSIKMDFNERLLALRDLKMRIIDRVKSDNIRIREINQLLAVKEALFEPELESVECPEDRFRYTKESVAKFEGKRTKQAERAKRAAQKKQGFGNFGNEESDGSDEEPAKAEARTTTPGSIAIRGRPSGHATRAERLQNVPPSETEVAELVASHRKLTYEKQMLLEKMNKTISTFDSALDDLRHEKFKLEGDLKTTDMKMLVLYQELVLLKEFELRDTELIKKLDAKKGEKADIVAKITECQEKLIAKKAEIERLLEKDKEVHEEFQSIVGEKDKLYEPLLKIFKKKIKRTKKKQTKDNADDDFNSDDDDDDDDESEYNSDEEEEEEEVCPPGCEQQVYERVCTLRERRLDQEDVLNEIQKSIEVLKKENDTLVKKEKVIDSALKAAEGEIQAFQTEKQQKLNELDVVLTLKLHQVQCLIDGVLPSDLSQCLIFTNDGLYSLKQRIKDLKDERGFQRRKQKDLDHEHLNLLKEKKVRMQKKSELEARAFDVQMLKFGQAINLEMIEKMSVNKTADEMKERIRKEERERLIELEQWQQTINTAKDELMQSTQRNTAKLHKLAELSQTQQRLEATLNQTQNTVAAEYNTLTKKEGQDRKHLVEIIQRQQQEIEALRAEINMLGHKGGHIYAPVPQANSSGDPLARSGTKASKG